jgi:hypothetical protein
MSITVSIGQLTGGANDLLNAYNAWASGTPVLPFTGVKSLIGCTP